MALPRTQVEVMRISADLPGTLLGMSLTRDSLRWSPTREGFPSSDDGFLASDIVAAQDALEAEASEVIPFQFDVCSGDAGYLKQSVFACQTCLNYAGVCAGCSVKCHGEHQLVELFTRRDFKCDCGTERMGAGSFCSLANRDDAPPNHENKYTQNFKGEFCFCGVEYDPHTETDAMYQCLVCEDWLHHACLFGSHSDAGISPLATDDFDMLVCASCVKDNPRLRKILDRWAGVEGKGVMVIDEENKVLGNAHLDPDDDDDEAESEPREPPQGGVEAGGGGAGKRKAIETEGDLASSDDEEKDAISRQAKKPKRTDSPRPEEASSPDGPTASISSAATLASTAASSQPASEKAGCSAPPAVAKGESVLDKLAKEGARLNVYLEEGWMERWCRCSDCLVDLNQFPFMLDDEDIYEPPADPDAHKSTLELGMEALERMPRGQAIDGVTAFTGLSERLRAFLRPKAEAGETITKDMVDEFFACERERSTLR